MTKRQHDTLVFIEAFVAAKGYSPSFEEIKNHLGLASKSGVHRLIHGLRDRGLVRMQRGARSIAVGAEDAA